MIWGYWITIDPSPLHLIHCFCTLFPTLQTFQGAEEFFHSHIIESKAWTESFLSVAFLAQPQIVLLPVTLQQPSGTVTGFCRSAGSSTLLEHPPGVFRRTQNPVAGSESGQGADGEHPAGAGHWGRRAFGTHVWQTSAAASPLCQLPYRSERGCCRVPGAGDNRMTHEKPPDSLQFSVCEIK